MRTFSTIFAALAILACGPRALPPEPPIVLVPSDAGTACGRACDQLRASLCPEGAPNKAGQACEQTCADGIADRLLSPSYPDCVVAAGSRSALRACGVRCGSAR